MNMIWAWDETTSGNILTVNSGKKCCIVYRTLKELDTQSPAFWFPICVASSSDLKHKIPGGLGPVLLQLLRLTASDELLRGFPIEPLGLGKPSL